MLNEWGKNFACDPVITRVDPSTLRMQVLVCSSLASPGAWCLPGGTILNLDSNNLKPEEVKLPVQRQLPQFLTKIYNHNVRNNRKPDREMIADPEAEFTSFLHSQSVIRYQGYCDDPRNTDDAWMETVVHHTHLPDDWARFLDISPTVASWCPPPIDSSLPKPTPYEYRWIPIDSGLPAYTGLYASHFHFVQMCAPFCRCGRREFDQTDGSHRRAVEAASGGMSGSAAGAAAGGHGDTATATPSPMWPPKA